MEPNETAEFEYLIESREKMNTIKAKETVLKVVETTEKNVLD